MDTVFKWNDFGTNVTKSFDRLRDQEAFYDVTLVSDDQKKLSAHKVILSSGSEYFRNILTSHTRHPHPLLCLDGVSFTELNYIIEYIYRGEVRVGQTDIVKFLKLAQKFGIEGILQDDNQRVEFNDSSAKSATSQGPSTDVFDRIDKYFEKKAEENIRRKELEEDMKDIKDNEEEKKDDWFKISDYSSEESSALVPYVDIEESDSEMIEDDLVAEEPTEEQTPKTEETSKRKKRGVAKKYEHGVKIKVTHENVEEIFQQNITYHDDAYVKDRWRCEICMKTARNKHQLKDHMELHFTGLEFKCTASDECGQVFPTRNILRVHVFKCKRKLGR